MYKYYSELEHKKDFKILLNNSFVGWPDKISIMNAKVQDKVLEECKDLFKAIPTIDLLIKELENRFVTNKNEILEVYYDILDHQQENGFILERYDHSLICGAFDLKEFLSEYLFYVERLIVIYPEKKVFLSNVKDKLKNIITELNKVLSIELISSPTIEYPYPDSWYITPTGYLYNSGGDYAHKEGNLVNAYSRVRSSLSDEVIEFQVLDRDRKKSGPRRFKFALPEDNSRERINEILKNGYVEFKDFLHYTNIMYTFPELIGLNQPVGEERSYQKNMRTLIIGYIAAEACFYKSFSKLLNSASKEEVLRRLEQLTASDLDDILVRFSKFHKISRVADKTITTASLDGIDLFSEYLKRGWTLEILPPIIYDAYQDKVEELSLNSLFVSRYLDEKLDNYKGKGKILIKK